MTSATAQPAPASGVAEVFDRRLALLLAAAMFVLVVDTSLMNVSISAVVTDLGTTVSGVQSAIALEALVSAAFILISSKVGDLIGRKKAYTLGLLGYAVGALAMVLAQELRAVIIFWAIFGGLGASLLLPSMQSLIHGNFEGANQKRVYALVGASAAIAAAIGPLLGGFITTFLSWRVGFALELVVIIVVLSGLGRIKDVLYTGAKGIDLVGAVFSVLGMGGLVLGILVWQEGGEAVGAFLAVGAISLASLAWWLVRRKREGKLPLIDPDLFRSKMFRLGISGQTLQQIALGGAMIALPIFLQMVLEYNALQAGLSLAPLSLSMFAVATLAGKRAGDRRPASIIRFGFLLLTIGIGACILVVPRADSGLWFAIPLARRRLGSGPAGLPAQQLHPRPDLRGAHQRGGRGQLGRRVVRAVARSRPGRQPDAGLARVRVHGPGRVEHGPAARGAAAGRDGPRRGRPAHEQHRARCADRQPAARVRGRDHPDQHRGAADRAPGRAARAVAGRVARPDHLVPDDAAAGRQAVGRPGGPGAGLTVSP